ncbi:MAG: hypothetical protein FWB91_10945 [Defluviitaleaceae bacterium]|nr:hypothetical protein [Defluviitaleaceae bacterium]
MGIIAAAVLVPVIAIVAFFALRSGPDYEPPIADAPNTSVHTAQAETPTVPAPVTDEDEWVLITNINDGFTLNIPVSWSYSYNEWGSFNISGEGVDGTVEMIAGHIPTDSISGLIFDSTFSDHFIFDNGQNGVWLEFDDGILWIDRTAELFFRLLHDGDMSVFIDNEDLILRIARSLTPLTVNVQSTGDWTIISSGGMSLHIPSAWSYVSYDDGPISIVIRNEDDSIDLFAGYMIAGDPQIFVDENNSQPFHFSDGSAGYMVETPDAIKWMPLTGGFVSCCGISLYHGGNRAIFTNNEDLLLSIARSLTFGAPDSQNIQWEATAQCDFYRNIVIDGLEIHLVSYYRIGRDSTMRPTEDGDFIYLFLNVTNIGNVPHTLNPVHVSVFGPEGRQINPVSDRFMGNNVFASGRGNILPGMPQELVIIVPFQEAGDYVIHLSDSISHASFTVPISRNGAVTSRGFVGAWMLDPYAGNGNLFGDQPTPIELFEDGTARFASQNREVTVMWWIDLNPPGNHDFALMLWPSFINIHNPTENIFIGLYGQGEGGRRELSIMSHLQAPRHVFYRR